MRFAGQDPQPGTDLPVFLAHQGTPECVRLPASLLCSACSEFVADFFGLTFSTALSSSVVDHFLGTALKDEVMKIMPVQKQTRAGQRTRFKAFVVVGDHNGHVGLGVKCAKEVATAIRGAIINAKLNVVPVRRGYWGNKLGKPHTVPTKITGKGGSVSLRLVPAPKGAGIVAASTPKKVLNMAGIVDVYTASQGHTKTMGNFIKATFAALGNTYGFLTPDLWRETRYTKPPAQEFTDLLAKGKGH